jgi:hypothetical protein
MSARRSTLGSPAICSGAMYAGVPIVTPSRDVQILRDRETGSYDDDADQRQNNRIG